MTDFSARHFWWRISSLRASMPRTSIWAPLVHKTTIGQIILSNLLLKPMLPAKGSDTRNAIENHNAGYHPHLHRQHHCTPTCNLESAICFACLNWFAIGAKNGVMSESRSVLMAESKSAMVVDVLTNPPRTCLCLAMSVWQTPKAMTDRIP